MKPVEEAFASATFRRVILPGIVATVGIHPILSRYMPLVQKVYGIGSLVLLVTEILVFGLFLSAAIQWIYYIYEGIELPWLTTLAHSRNSRRLQEQTQVMEMVRREGRVLRMTPAEQATYEYLTDFPMTREGVRYAHSSTRLGNVIASYEGYADSRYGFEGVFYWNHILDLVPAQARASFDDQYSLAESLVLTSFAGAVIAGVHTIALIGFAISGLCPIFPAVTVSWGSAFSFTLLMFGLIVWFLFYQAAIPAHREAGRLFRAITDGAVPQLVKWAESADAPLPQSAQQKLRALEGRLKDLL